MKYIEILEENKLISTIDFIDRTYLIGKDPSCNIVLGGNNISPIHARLIKDKDSIQIYSLVPAKSLFVNDRPITSTIVCYQDVVTIEEFTIRFTERKEDAIPPVMDISLLKQRMHETLIEKIDLKKAKIEELADQELRNKCDLVLSEIIAQANISAGVDKEKLKKDILDEALALGPLQDLLRDDEITEIMVNSKDKIYVERNGKIELTNFSFTSDEHIQRIIGRIINPIGRRIDESVPMVDARLKDGSRVNAIIPPLALKGSSITIRKFPKEVFTDEHLIRFGTLTPKIMEFLNICVRIKKNILVSGGTGTGKTSLLNALSSAIPSSDRLITIEDTAELKLPHENLVSLESRPPNIEGKGAITIRDLVRNSLRMRPDRIVVGECRGEEALDMLQAMNTGHEGSLTTVHANSAKDALMRLETMVMMAGTELPSLVIKNQIVSAINIIVQLSRFQDGSRKVVSVSEIKELVGEEIIVKDIFIFRRTETDSRGKVLGEFIPTGYIPDFVDGLGAMGIKISKDIFKQEEN